MISIEKLQSSNTLAIGHISLFERKFLAKTTNTTSTVNMKLQRTTLIAMSVSEIDL